MLPSIFRNPETIENDVRVVVTVVTAGRLMIFSLLVGAAGRLLESFLLMLLC